MKQVLVSLSSYSNNLISLLKKNNFNVIKNSYQRKLKEDEIITMAKNCLGIIAGTEYYSDELLSKLNNNLKCISRVGVGVDNIDLNYCIQNKIKVFTSGSLYAYSVAELITVNTINYFRKIIQHDNLIKQGTWLKIKGNNLINKKIGFVGYGKIAKQAVKMLKPFKPEFFFYDINNKIQFNKNYITKMSLRDLFKKCDVISLNLPFNVKSKNIINKNLLNLTSGPTLIINTSRGGILNESDLIKWLQKNNDNFAYLDVFNNEPYDGLLTNLDNCILSPHIGTFTSECRDQMEEEAALKLIKFLDKSR